MLVKLDFAHSVFSSLVTDWFSTSQLQPANYTFLKGKKRELQADRPNLTYCKGNNCRNFSNLVNVSLLVWKILKWFGELQPFLAPAICQSPGFVGVWDNFREDSAEDEKIDSYKRICCVLFRKWSSLWKMLDCCCTLSCSSAQAAGRADVLWV